MSFELGEALRRCGLETGGRRHILDALACYTDEETGLASASQVTLAVHAGMSERHAKRILAELLADESLAGLVRLVRPSQGRGRVAVYQLMIGRIEPLAAAIKASQRVARAGVAMALLDAGLCGKALSPDNMRSVFTLLARLMRAEGNPPAAAAVEAQAALFEAFLASETPVRRPDGSQAAQVEPEFDFDAPGTDEKPPAEACEMAVEETGERGTSCPEKGDNLSRKGDILSSAHIRNLSPQGYTPTAPEAREADEILIAGQAVRPRDFYLDPMAMIGHVTACRADRRAFGEAFAGRRGRIDAHGTLTIVCSHAAEAEWLAERWLEPLVSYARDIGLAGVVFAARAKPPP
ncbi:MAG: hypothetical protein C0421_05755 [Hyphomonas sp.]|uniref:hypothetical protein n=1 Tax=Hyphomonas sp. TaxID=87 RepID=UPI0025BD67AD|nr:hypothetical protein [Hyphomonas sp.]MBA4338331.1 hypothetical protein [Hyphomonas sp.]